MYALFYAIFAIVATILDNMLGTTSDSGLDVISGLFSLALLLPTFAVTVRRLHDIGKSGWWALITFTGVGDIFLLFWLVKDSQPGENKYGPNPKGIV